MARPVTKIGTPLKDKLADLKIERRPVTVQQLFDEYKKHLHLREVITPLPETVTLLPENFLYWIKLENPNPNDASQWVTSRASVVVPKLENKTFDQNGFRFDLSRAKGLSLIPNLLRAPDCIHKNLRHQAVGDDGGIRGEYIYVTYYGKKQRKVAFTVFDPDIDKKILVTSFWTYKKWVAECTEMPAVYVRNGCVCSCK
jgi:hypothetical protein